MRFDTKAAQFDLLVESPEVLQHTVGAPAHLIARAVQARARLTQRVGDKAFGSQPRPLQVATRQTDTADAQLTRHPGWQRVQLTVENTAQHVAQRSSNGRALAVFGAAVPMGNVDGGFGGAVAVMQLHLWPLRQHPIAQLGRQRFAPREQATQAVALRRLGFIHKQTQQRWHKVQGGHAKLLHQLRDTLRVAVLAGGGQYQWAPGDQRPEALPHRHVKTDRRFLHQHIVGV